MDRETRTKLAITFDAEWWGRANLLEGVPLHAGIDRDIEAVYESLELLSTIGARATFFVVSDDFSSRVLLDVVDQGSEIASHSMTHPLFSSASREEWARQISGSKRTLEDATGVPVRGFRAPSWSVPFEGKDAFLALLREAGYRYDSSFCSFETSLYGDARFPRSPQVLDDGFVEIPVPRIGFPAWPWVGGFYFRLMPNLVLSRFIRKESPAFLYFHPWELYPAETRQELSLMDRILVYYGRRRNKEKLRRLLESLKSAYELVPLGELVDELLAEGERKAEPTS